MEEIFIPILMFLKRQYFCFLHFFLIYSGVIMSAITLAGKKGGLAALAVLAIFTGREFMKSDSDK